MVLVTFGLPLAVEFGKKLPVVGFDITCNVLKNGKQC